MSFKDYKLLTCLMLLMVSSIIWGLDSWTREYTPLKIEYIEGMGWMEFDVMYDLEDVLIAQDGGYIVSGSVSRDIPDTPPVYWDYWGFVMKTDFEGNVLWADADSVSFMGWNNNSAIVETDEGDIISVGYSNFEGCMIKRNCDGERQWTMNISDFVTNSICKTNDGNLMLGGIKDSNFALRKIDNDGNEIWTRSYDFTYTTRAFSLTQAEDESYLLAGKIYLDNNVKNIFVIKTNSLGDTLWTRIYDNELGIDEGRCIIETDSEIVISGTIEASITNNNAFLWKLDTDGNNIWSYEFYDVPLHYFYSVLYTSDGNYVTSGEKIVKSDEQHNILWNEELTGSLRGLGDRSIQEASDGGFIYLSGNFYSISINKTDENGQVTGSNDNILETNSFNLFNYPNPFNPETTIYFSTTEGIENAEIVIYNIKGQCIHELRIKDDGLSTGSVIWDGTDDSGSHVSSGIYFYRLEGDNFVSEASRMILLK